jgi:signal peptidase I
VTLRRTGVAVAIGTVVLPILWPVALVIGIVLLMRRSMVAGIVTLVLGALVLPAAGAALWSAFVIKPFRTASESMEPELRLGERFVVLRLDKSPSIGDIVVFNPPTRLEPGACVSSPPGGMCAASSGERADADFVMRVVGLGGDRLAMRRGRVIRNREEERRMRLGTCVTEACEFPREIVVPDGHVFLLGDNRGKSFDSRFWGPVPEEWIEGRYWFSYAGG